MTNALTRRPKYARDGFSLSWVVFWLLVSLTFWPSLAKAQQSAPAKSSFAVAATTARDTAAPAAIVTRVDSVGMTVSDMDRSVDFFSKVLYFEKISDVEVAGEDYEHLQGLIRLRMRLVRMILCEEVIQLSHYMAPIGIP